MPDLTSVGIEGDFIVIRVPIKTMCHAFENDPNNEQWDGEQHRELEREEEDGTTPVHLMMDKAMVEAVEQGSQWVELPTDKTALVMQKP